MYVDAVVAFAIAIAIMLLLLLLLYLNASYVHRMHDAIYPTLVSTYRSTFSWYIS